MGEVKIRIAEDRKRFSPGATVAGRAEWSFEGPPKRVDVRLYWRTEGRGIEDVSVLSQKRAENPGARGVLDFKFTLPEEPHSFTGTLVSLRWGVEVIVAPKDESARAEFSMGPGDRETMLKSPEAEPNDGAVAP